MIHADDPAQIGTVLWIFAVPFFKNFRRLFDDFALNFFRTQNIIWGDTCLAGVYEFSPQYAFRRHRYIRGIVYVHGAEKIEIFIYRRLL